jgi:hypothetical protein
MPENHFPPLSKTFCLWRGLFKATSRSQALIVGAINNTHPACTYFLDDEIVAKRMADELGGSGRWREC